MIDEKTPVLEKAAARLTEVSEEDAAATRRQLERERIFKMDQRDRINTARKEGLAEGLAEGRAEGRKEAMEEAFKLFEKGLSTDEIINILTSKTLKSLKSNSF
jgi:flagellar biosynthesis/type III secretory pathway protein FliH